MKIFDKRIFLKHQSVLQWNISIQWDKNSDGKSWYSPPPLSKLFRYRDTPPPLIQTFSIPEIIATIKDSPTKFFDSETKNFRRKLVIPPIMHKIFSIPQIFWNIEGMPTNIFGTVRQKNFDGKTWYPLVCINFFDTLNFLKHWRDAHEIFRHCETKKFRRKNVIPPSMHKIFRYPKFSETLKGCPRNFSVLWEKNFDGKTWYPLVCIKFFDTLNFLEHLGHAHEIFWHCETKNFRRKNVIPPFSSIIFFETKNCKNSRISLRKFSALWDKNFR